MARKSKSAKNSKETEASDGSNATEAEAADAVETTESSSEDDPVIIEAEAVEVTPSDEISPEETSSSDEGTPTDGGSAGPSDASNDETSDIEPDSIKPEEKVEEPSDVVEPVAVVSPPPEPARASPVPLVIGGLIAGAVGYIAATFAQPAPVDTTALSESVEANGAQLEALVGTVADLQNAPVVEVDLGDVETALADLAGRLDGMDGDIASVRDEITSAMSSFEETSNTLSDRLTVLETAGPGDSEEARATEQDLAAFRAELDRITAEAESRVATSMEKASEIEAAAIAAAAEAEEAAAEAERQAAEAAALAETEAAIAIVKTAIESGQSFSDQISTLGDVPDVLSANADSGVVTLIELQQSFPDAARTALASGEAIPQDASAGERLTAFFKKRTNARSLSPKDGDSADAVLSRAEAMMKQGDLSAALAELDALGEAPKAAMQSWLDQAKTREAALAAVEQLTVTN